MSSSADVLASGDVAGCRHLLAALAASQAGVVLAFGRTRNHNTYALTPGVFPENVRVCSVNLAGEPDVQANFNDHADLARVVTEQLGLVRIIGAFFDWSTTKFIGVDGHPATCVADWERGHTDMFTCVANFLVPGGFLLFEFDGQPHPRDPHLDQLARGAAGAAFAHGHIYC
jgi:hypothetical protein